MKRPFHPDWWSAREIHAPDGRLCYEGFYFTMKGLKGAGTIRHVTITHDDLLPLGGTFLLFQIEERTSA